jgi:hypothetical protein
MSMLQAVAVADAPLSPVSSSPETSEAANPPVMPTSTTGSEQQHHHATQQQHHHHASSAAPQPQPAHPQHQPAHPAHSLGSGGAAAPGAATQHAVMGVGVPCFGLHPAAFMFGGFPGCPPFGMPPFMFPHMAAMGAAMSAGASQPAGCCFGFGGGEGGGRHAVFMQMERPADPPTLHTPRSPPPTLHPRHPVAAAQAATR